MKIARPEDLIDDARNGRMFILVDDEDRENEGDLVIPAQMATPEAINFMATHGRGLICLSLTPERVSALGLPPMTQGNRSRHATAFTVSIEARDGVSTGISAADRARTIATAIDGSKGAEHIVSPGHIFPLVARPGGVLTRAGHTEAAVDVARLAGLIPAGVICEIMDDDGTMRRLDSLIPFAHRHNLKIGTIRDLIAYRLRHDNAVRAIREFAFDSEHGGHWTCAAFRDEASGEETFALIKGVVSSAHATLVRMHQFSILEDALGASGSRRGGLVRAMQMIAGHGAGVIVVLNRPVPDFLSRTLSDPRQGGTAGHPTELRNYGLGAQVLARLGVRDMVLITDSDRTPIALAGYGLNVVGQRALTPTQAGETV